MLNNWIELIKSRIAELESDVEHFEKEVSVGRMYQAQLTASSVRLRENKLWLLLLVSGKNKYAH